MMLISAGCPMPIAHRPLFHLFEDSPSVYTTVHVFKTLAAIIWVKRVIYNVDLKVCPTWLIQSRPFFPPFTYTFVPNHACV